MLYTKQAPITLTKRNYESSRYLRKQCWESFLSLPHRGKYGKKQQKERGTFLPMPKGRGLLCLTMMNKISILNILEKSPNKIFQAEKDLSAELKILTGLKNTLQDKEYSLITSGEIKGENEQKRKAQLFLLTKEDREAIEIQEEVVMNKKIFLNLCVNEFETYKILANKLLDYYD